MAPKFALFTKGSKLPLNKGFKNMFTIVLRSTLELCLLEYDILTEWTPTWENVPSDKEYSYSDLTVLCAFYVQPSSLVHMGSVESDA